MNSTFWWQIVGGLGVGLMLAWVSVPYWEHHARMVGGAHAPQQVCCKDCKVYWGIPICW